MTDPQAGRQAGGPAVTDRLVTVEIEQALGPGVDFVAEPGSPPVGRRARTGGVWLGFDRGALLDSDDGSGRRIPVLVASPVSTFDGARLRVELAGGWRTEGRTTLLGRVPGASMPITAFALVVGGLDQRATSLDADTAVDEARRARRRERQRRSQDRIRDGRAWQPAGLLAPESARFATPHSAAEYRIGRLPPRFVRGLEHLLDDDERVLYWVERPLARDVGIAQRLRGAGDRRAALLVLTDRQLLWMIDHARPDRYLSDWGVDVDLVPIERLQAVRESRRATMVELAIATAAGTRSYALPSELVDEVRLMAALLRRFLPGGPPLPRRRYGLDPIAFDPSIIAPFGQVAEARALHDAAVGEGEVLAFQFSPRRKGQRSPEALVLRPRAVEVGGGRRSARLALGRIASISLTLSPLVGRLSFGPGVAITYPAPLAEHGAALTRLARRAIADWA